jgi:hypothetical protein
LFFLGQQRKKKKKKKKKLFALKMSAVAPDWLSVLKSAISNGEPIEVNGDEFTNRRHERASQHQHLLQIAKGHRGGGGPYYTVGQVWHFYRLRELVHAKYVTEIGSGAVSYVDRKDLLSYVLGEVSSSKCIKPYNITTTTTTTTIADVGPSVVESSSSTAVPAQVDENDDAPLANVAASDAIAAVPLPTHSPTAKSVSLRRVRHRRRPRWRSGGRVCRAD